MAFPGMCCPSALKDYFAEPLQEDLGAAASAFQLSLHQTLQSVTRLTIRTQRGLNPFSCECTAAEEPVKSPLPAHPSHPRNAWEAVVLVLRC